MGMSPSTTHDVFISYSWDSDDHVGRVLSLAHWLRQNGVDAWLDKYEDAPRESWPLWCHRMVEGATHVLVVCTETYERRALRREAPTVGRGVTWESAIITADLYDDTGGQEKFIPVVFEDADFAHVPFFLRGYSRYNVNDQESLTLLYARLTSQRLVEPAQLGQRTLLPRRVLETPPAVRAPATAAPSAPPQQVITPHHRLADVIEGEWIVDITNPALGPQTMRLRMRSRLGKRRFEAVAVVGSPGWKGSGEWEVLPPGNRVVFRGLQRMPLYPQAPLQEAYTFEVVERDGLQGQNAAGMPVQMRRER